jgi:predicted Zn-dependent protease
MQAKRNSLLKEVMGVSRENLEGMLAEATQRYSQGDLDAAVDILRGFRALEPDDHRATKLLASLYHVQERREEAESAYREAIAVDGDDPYLLVGLGEFLLEEMRIDEAAPFFEKLFALDPTGVHPAANRGRQLVQEFYKAMNQ